MIKIVVTGAYSTGKTTLVQDLADTLARRGVGLQVLPDISRTCPMPLNTDQTDDTTLWLIGSQISAEVAAAASGADVVLCDRGIPDILSHHLEVLGRRPERRVELLRAFLDEWVSTYDLLLLSRVDETIPVVADGLRVTDPAYRSLLDLYAAQVVEGRAASVTLPFGEPARLETALQAIARRLAASPAAAT
jgi:nicotinamide riboside kinase